jgi:DNA replication protein DnaC
LRNAKLRSEACLEDFDWREPRGLDRAQVRGLATSDWVRQHHNLLLSGPTGVGKSFLASAFAHKACRDGFTALQLRAGQLFRDLAVAHADGSFARLLRRMAHIDVLVIDDFAMAPMSDPERRDFLEICDDRYGFRSTILTSQLPVANWHAQVGDPTVADSILDRLVHNSYSLVLKGGSMRKARGAGEGQ